MFDPIILSDWAELASFHEKSGLVKLKYIFISILIFLCSFSSLQVSGNDENEDSLTFHKLATRIFPELDIAVSKAIEDVGPTTSESVLIKTAADAYRYWYEDAQKIKNMTVPASALLLVEKLHPRGFDETVKRHSFKEPETETYSHSDQVLYYFLQVIGTAIDKNDALQPLQAELSDLFQCKNQNCEILPDATSEVEVPSSLSDSEKLKLVMDCMNREKSQTDKMREEFCDSFLTWTLQ